LDVPRVKRIVASDDSEEPVPPRGKPPQLCTGCPHRASFQMLKNLDCIIAGDIGCYTLSVLPPFETMDTVVCMGASIGVGLGMRHVLPEEQARKVVSVIGDGTFMHSGLTGIAEMVYNRPATGHVVVILDNGTTAMTGLQEHPGTGKSLDHNAAGKTLSIENTVTAMGVDNVVILDPAREIDTFKKAMTDALESNDLTVIIARRPCILAVVRDAKFERGEKVR
jgi:indolepyruvate ferredoxin oxidoreductase alpha subunit